MSRPNLDPPHHCTVEEMEDGSRYCDECGAVYDGGSRNA